MEDNMAAELLTMARRLREIREQLPGNLEREWLDNAIMHLDDVLVLHERECSCCGPDGWRVANGD